MRIAVYCGSSRRTPERHLDTAARLGALLAERRHVLVYGGGRTGSMGAVARGALEAGGTVHGVILREFIQADVHHDGLHELHSVDDMRARKRGLDERADAFIALPGGLGTLEELAEILSFRKLRHHHRLLVLLDTGGFYGALVSQIERAIDEGFDDPSVRDYLAVTADPTEAVDLCERSAG